MEEFMYLGLRMIDGVSRDDFMHSFGMPIEAVYQKVLNHRLHQELPALFPDVQYSAFDSQLTYTLSLIHI